MDMIMLTLFNAREREAADWIELFKKADPRFSNAKIWTPEGAAMAIIEIAWEGWLVTTDNLVGENRLKRDP